MMDDISLKRERIKEAYGGSPSWKQKVNAMSDSQVVAVYLRLQKANKIG